MVSQKGRADQYRKLAAHRLGSIFSLRRPKAVSFGAHSGLCSCRQPGVAGSLTAGGEQRGASM